MKKILVLLVLLACRGEGHGFGHGAYGGGPDFGLARIDDKQMLHIRVFSGTRLIIQENTVLKKNDKGELVPHSVKMGRRTLEETAVTLPLAAVKGFDTEGKPIANTALAPMLAKETIAVVTVGEPRPEQLKLLKPGIVVLSVPVPLRGHYGVVIQGGPVPAPPPKKVQ